MIDEMRRPRTLFLLILLMCSLVAGGGFAQQKVSIAVFPFTGGGLSASELRSLTLIFEESLSKVASLQVIDQSKREKVLAYLEPSLLTCEDIDCAIRAGRTISADTIVLGTISGAGQKRVITATVIDVKSGKGRKVESPGAESMTEMTKAARLLASTLFGTLAPGDSSADAASADLANAQRSKALESLRANLRTTIAEIDRKRAASHAWGWAFMGVGIVSAGLSGASWYKSDQAYQDYKSTSDTARAQYYREQVTLWDTLMLVSAGTAVLSIGGSIPFFVLAPNSREEKKELKRIETEMGVLENREGTAK
jgi:hypothetical protein